MVGDYVDDVIVSGDKNACEKFFAQLKEELPVKNQGELKMYTGCAFVRDWESGVLEINQTAYVGKSYSAVWNFGDLEIPGCRLRF